MIVNDRGDYFEWIDQHEHARISGLLFLEWKDPEIESSSLREVLYHAIRYHDRAWISLDRNPKWNELENRPYSFIDYPEKEKLKAYERGIDESTKEHVYCGLLSSRHYVSFFPHPTSTFAQQFVKREKERQQLLRKKVPIPLEEEEQHFKLLQWMDDISLYMCMNQPGAPKEEEISWFRHGFRHTFPFLNEQMIIASFVSADTIQLEPFPFQRSGIHVTIETAHIDKKTIQQDSFHSAFRERKKEKRAFQLVSSRKEAL